MKAAIFDLDGLLIDSEPLWRQAEQMVFGALGVPLTDAMCEQTMGRRIDEVVAYWYRRFPWQGRALDDVARDIVHRMEGLITSRGEAMAGAGTVLGSLREQGLDLALASSSPLELIRIAVGKLGLGDYFSVICSAMDERYGKPDPAVYRTAASRLAIAPGECLVFEDSVAGVRAAKRAGMAAIAVPSPGQYDDPEFLVADVKLRSLNEFRMEIILDIAGADQSHDLG